MVCYNLDRFTGGLALAGTGGRSVPRPRVGPLDWRANVDHPPSTTQNPTLVSHPVTQPRHSLWNPDDEFTRRSLLRRGIGGLGLSLTGLLHAQAHARQVESVGLPPLKACVIVFYYGGPSHIDTYDLKPDAPAEVRGEFKPISTTVPGMFVCEHLPKMARVMHKVALVRSMHHQNRLHDSASTEALTGRQAPTGDREEFAPIKQVFPSYGAVVDVCPTGHAIRCAARRAPVRVSQRC